MDANAANLAKRQNAVKIIMEMRGVTINHEDEADCDEDGALHLDENEDLSIQICSTGALCLNLWDGDDLCNLAETSNMEDMAVAAKRAQRLLNESGAFVTAQYFEENPFYIVGL